MQSDIISPDRLRTDPRLLAEVKRLSKVSEIRGLAAVAWQWMVISSSIACWSALPTDMGVIRWALYVLVVIIIGSRQHALLIMMHEAAHGRISKNRAWNDFIGDVFCALPHGLTTELYRRRHLKHHIYTNTDKDPDWVSVKPYKEWHWPKKPIDAFILFTTEILGLNGHKTIAALMIWSPVKKIIYGSKLNLTRTEMLRFLLFCSSCLLVFTLFSLWLGFLLFWLIPIFTSFAFLSHYRSIAEHMVVESEHELNKTRHVESNLFERMIVAPLNVNYHLTHHLYPSIPFYHLPEMHRILMCEEVFRNHAHLTPSYWGIRHGVWAELTQTHHLPDRMPD